MISIFHFDKQSGEKSCAVWEWISTLQARCRSAQNDITENIPDNVYSLSFQPQTILNGLHYHRTAKNVQVSL